MNTTGQPGIARVIVVWSKYFQRYITEYRRPFYSAKESAGLEDLAYTLMLPACSGKLSKSRRINNFLNDLLYWNIRKWAKESFDAIRNKWKNPLDAERIAFLSALPPSELAYMCDKSKLIKNNVPELKGMVKIIFDDLVFYEIEITPNGVSQKVISVLELLPIEVQEAVK